MDTPLCKCKDAPLAPLLTRAHLLTNYFPMRVNYKLQRLYVPHDLGAGASFEADRAQSHYLAHVLRMNSGAPLLLFNGRDGEWLARIATVTKKSVLLDVETLERPQPSAPDLLYAFAPLKVGRLDYMVQKAVEMGAGILQPVITQHTQLAKPPMEKMQANLIEAAEQCGVLSLPVLRPPVKLDALLASWQENRRLIFCDEAAKDDAPLPALQVMEEDRIGLLIGPEGGFSQEERQKLRALPFVTAIKLGPLILRADTAAVAALALVQATLGDWHSDSS